MEIFARSRLLSGDRLGTMGRRVAGSRRPITAVPSLGTILPPEDPLTMSGDIFHGHN